MCSYFEPSQIKEFSVSGPDWLARVPPDTDELVRSTLYQSLCAYNRCCHASAVIFLNIIPLTMDVKQSSELKTTYPLQTQMEEKTPLIDVIPGSEVLLRFLVKWHVDEGHDFSKMTLQDGRTALHCCAAENSDTATVQLLIDSGASVTATSKDGSTILHEAARHGNVEIGKLLIESGASIHAVESKNGNTALHEAVDKNNKEMAQLLIDSGASVDAVDESGRTPLLDAASGGATELAQLLIDKGASVNAVDENGSTALHEAGSNTEMAQLLIDNGASVDAADQDGCTLLHAVVSSLVFGLEMAQLLIDNGASVNAADQDGRTPLHKASSSGGKEMAQLLIDNGASVNATGELGFTPLHETNNPDMLLLLIENGASLDATNQDGDSTLSLVMTSHKKWGWCHSAPFLLLLRAMGARGMVPAEMASDSWSSGRELQDYLDHVNNDLYYSGEEGSSAAEGLFLRGTGLRAVMARARDEMHPEPPSTSAVVVATRKRSWEQVR